MFGSSIHRHKKYNDDDCGVKGKIPLDPKGCDVCCSQLNETLIMAPPPYSDLGKQARDVFSKGYHFGIFKLDVNTKSSSGVEFSVAGVSNQETGNVYGSLETKCKIKDHGLTFSEKWNTDNIISADLSVQDKICQGLKLSADCSFSPQSGSKTSRLKTQYLNDCLALNCDMDLFMAGPIVQASAVFGYQGWLAGYQTAFDSQQSKVTHNNFAFGFSTADFILHLNVNDTQDFGCSVYQKVSSQLETGIQIAWSAGNSDTSFGIGAKYGLDRDACVRAKVNNANEIGLGYQQKIREGITLALSVLIDGKNFNGGAHKYGLALELES